MSNALAHLPLLVHLLDLGLSPLTLFCVCQQIVGVRNGGKVDDISNPFGELSDLCKIDQDTVRLGRARLGDWARGAMVGAHGCGWNRARLRHS